MGLCDDSEFQVRGHCPACGKEFLNLIGGELTCLAKGCPAPDTAHKLLQESEVHHLVKFDQHGFFTVQHPLRERADGSLFDCPVHNTVVGLMDMGYGPQGSGTWRLVGRPAVYIPGGPDQEPDWEWQEVEAGGPILQRPPDILYEQYQALTDEEKQARKDQFIAYSNQFPRGKYPRREQVDSEYQRYADSQRAEGYGPPGIYC